MQSLCLRTLGHGGIVREKRKQHTVVRKSQNLRRVVTHDAFRRLDAAYDIREVLGSGAFGEVSLVTDKISGRECVLKTINRSLVPDLDALEREVSLQSELDHPHIVRVYETILDDARFHICLELCQGGDLSAAIEEQGARTEEQTQYLTLQILQAVRYIHDMEVVHRDLKLENFLLQHQGVPLDCNIVKLIDFGFARRFGPGTPTLQTVCGSPGFMAPEIISGQDYDERCDIFSCGVIIFSMLTDRLPFDGDNWREILRNTQQMALTFTDFEKDTLSEPVRALIMLMCRKRPSGRPDAQKVLRSAWLHDIAISPMQSPFAAKDIMGRMRSYGSLDELAKASLWRVAYNLTDSEVAKMREAFKSIDADGDGKITLQELCAEAATDDELDRLQAVFSEIDSNHNGWLDYTEFLATMLCRRGELPETAIRAAFRSFDSDNSGSISEKEVAEALSGTGVHASFERADSNGDGQLSYEEFRDMLRSTTDLAKGSDTPLAARILIRANTAEAPPNRVDASAWEAPAGGERPADVSGQCPSGAATSEAAVSSAFVGGA